MPEQVIVLFWLNGTNFHGVLKRDPARSVEQQVEDYRMTVRNSWDGKLTFDYGELIAYETTLIETDPQEVNHD